MENNRKHNFSLRDVILFSLLAFLFGMIAGFFIAPIKKGLNICCNNGNHFDSDECEEDFKDDLAMELNELR